MKKIALIIALVALVALALVACGNGGNSNKVTVHCSVSFVVDGVYILDGYEYDAVGTADAAPSVLKAAEDALMVNDIGYELDSNGKAFAMVADIDGTEYRTGTDAAGENVCAWVFTVNGEEPKARAGDTTLTANDVIEFSYFKTPIGTTGGAEE